MYLIWKGSLQGFQKYICHENLMILPEVTVFSHLNGRNDQIQAQIIEMVTWYIKLKQMNPESL